MKTNGLFKMVRPLALLTGLLPFSCSKTVTYSFVDVSVQVDPSVLPKELAAKVDSCEVAVTGAENVEGVVIPCVSAAKIGYDLGTFEWTTTLDKGQLRFVVTLFALNREIYGVGTSAPVDIIAGKRASSSVVVVVTPTTNPGTGGAGAVGGSSGVGGATAVGGQGGTPTGGAGGMVGQGGQGGQGGISSNGGAVGQGGKSGGNGGVGGGFAGGSSGVGGSSGAAGAGGLKGSVGGAAAGGKGGDSGGAGGV